MKLVVVGAGLWVLSPVDLIPEFLPVIGPLDDVVVVALALRYAARRIPREALQDAWPAEQRILDRLIGDRKARGKRTAKHHLRSFPLSYGRPSERRRGWISYSGFWRLSWSWLASSSWCGVGRHALGMVRGIALILAGLIAAPGLVVLT